MTIIFVMVPCNETINQRLECPIKIKISLQKYTFIFYLEQSGFVALLADQYHYIKKVIASGGY